MAVEICLLTSAVRVKGEPRMAKRQRYRRSFSIEAHRNPWHMSTEILGLRRLLAFEKAQVKIIGRGAAVEAEKRPAMSCRASSKAAAQPHSAGGESHRRGIVTGDPAAHFRATIALSCGRHSS